MPAAAFGNCVADTGAGMGSGALQLVHADCYAASTFIPDAAACAQPDCFSGPQEVVQCSSVHSFLVSLVCMSLQGCFSRCMKTAPSEAMNNECSMPKNTAGAVAAIRCAAHNPVLAKKQACNCLRAAAGRGAGPAETCKPYCMALWQSRGPTVCAAHRLHWRHGLRGRRACRGGSWPKGIP